MEKFNIWKVLALLTFVACVGCAATNPGTATKVDNVTGTGDASSGAGTGTGGTETGSAGTGDATSGAGTGTGGSTK